MENSCFEFLFVLFSEKYDVLPYGARHDPGLLRTECQLSLDSNFDLGPYSHFIEQSIEQTGFATACPSGNNCHPQVRDLELDILEHGWLDALLFHELVFFSVVSLLSN